MAAGVIGIRLNLDGVQRAQRGVRDTTRDVNRLGDAGRNASRGFGDFANGGILKGMNALKAGILGVGAAAGLSIVGVGAFVKESVDSLQRIERLNAQTEAVIKSTGAAAGVSARHLEDYVGQLENKTATEAESIQSGANLLLTFTNVKNGVGASNQIFDDALTVMTDMSRATDSTGSATLDMTSAAMQLGKALNDPIKGIGALRKVGVAFDEQQTKTIKKLTETGDVAGAQKIILAELTKEYGGSGAAFAATTQGKIELAKHAIGTLGETIATSALPPLGRLATAGADAMNQLATDFANGTGWIGQLQARFDEGLTAAKGFRDYVVNDLQVPQLLGDFYTQAKDKASEIINGLRDGVASGDTGGLAEGIGKGIAGGINAAMGKIGEYAPKMLESFKGLMAQVKWGELAMDVGKQVPVILLGLATGLANLDFASIWDFVKGNWLQILIGVITVAFAPAKIIGPVAKILGKIPLVGRLLEWLVKGLNGIGSKITGAVVGFMKTLAGRFLEGWRLGGPGIPSAIARTFSNALTHLYVWADDAVRWFGGLPGRFSAWLGELVGRFGLNARIAWDGLMGVFRRGGEALVGLLRTVGGWLLAPIRWVLDTVFKPLGTYVTGTLPGAFRTGFAKLLEPIQSALDKVKELKDLITGGLSTAFSKVTGGVSNLVGRVTGARAAGGPVAAGGTYLVGERGPELITPSHSATVLDNTATVNALRGSLSGLNAPAGGVGGETVIHNVIQLDGRVAFESWQRHASKKTARD